VHEKSDELTQLTKALKRDLVRFGERHEVSIIEMVSLLGTIVLELGIKLEQTAGIADRPKTYSVPLAVELGGVISDFGMTHHVTPIDMLSVLGALIIDIGASIDTAVTPVN